MTPADLITRVTAARDRFRAIRDSLNSTGWAGKQAHLGGRELDELLSELKAQIESQPSGGAK